jgi:hypothetical protein
MNGYKPNFFNKSLCESIRKSIQKIAISEDINQRMSDAIRAQAQERNRERKERKAAFGELETKVQQTMRDMAASNSSMGLNQVQNPQDQKELRARALDKLQQDADFTAKANQYGQAVGQYSGSGSAGRFGYRYDSQAEADAAAEASRKQLFDAQGRAKVFEKDPKTGTLVGRDAKPSEIQDRERRKADFEAAREADRNPPQRKPFSYVNPNSAEGRIEAQIKAGTMPDIWERDSSGRIIPGQGTGNKPQPSSATRPSQPSSATRPQPSTSTRPQPTTNVDKPGEALDDLSAARAAHKEFTDTLASEFQKAGGKALSPEADARIDAVQKKSAERVKNLRRHTTNPDIIKKFDTTLPAWHQYYNP